MKCKKLLLVSSLAVVFLASLTPLAMEGQGGFSSWLSINMTGVNNSYLTIGRDGVPDSQLTINQVIVIQELDDVRIYPLSCSFELLRPGDIRTTDSAFTIYNASNVTVNATISVSGDWIGMTDNWVHSDECNPGANTAGLRAVVEDGNGYSSVIVKKNEPYNCLVTNLAPGERRNFALEIYAPTEFSDYTPKENNILVTVSEA